MRQHRWEKGDQKPRVLMGTPDCLLLRRQLLICGISHGSQGGRKE